MPGFTLLEVLIALLILAVSAGAILNIVLSAPGSVEDIETTHQATQLVQSQLARVGQDLPLRPATYEGRSENGFGWTVTIEPYHLAEKQTTPFVIPYRVSVAVSHKQQKLSVVTLRLGHPERTP